MRARIALAAVALALVVGCHGHRRPDAAKTGSAGDVALVNVSGVWNGLPGTFGPDRRLRVDISPSGSVVVQVREGVGPTSRTVGERRGTVRVEGYHVEGFLPGSDPLLSPLSRWKADVQGGDPRSLWVTASDGRTFDLSWSSL